MPVVWFLLLETIDPRPIILREMIGLIHLSGLSRLLFDIAGVSDKRRSANDGHSNALLRSHSAQRLNYRLRSAKAYSRLRPVALAAALPRFSAIG
jgi:hypothetical protein